jgi:hypothetical protein
MEDHAADSVGSISDLTDLCTNINPRGIRESRLTRSEQAIATTSAVFLSMSINAGLGQHIGDLSDDDIAMTIKWSWVNQVLAIFAIALGKLAIVAFLEQIHGPEDRGKVIFLWAVAGSNLVINTITVGMILSQCSPLPKLWDERVPGTCNGRLRNQNCAYFQGSKCALLLHGEEVVD